MPASESKMSIWTHSSRAAYLDTGHVPHFPHVSNFCLGKRAGMSPFEERRKLSRLAGKPSKQASSP